MGFIIFYAAALKAAVVDSAFFWSTKLSVKGVG
jgi:hypothetical protein